VLNGVCGTCDQGGRLVEGVGQGAEDNKERRRQTRMTSDEQTDKQD